jgi:hypothetical protein
MRNRKQEYPASSAFHQGIGSLVNTLSKTKKPSTSGLLSNNQVFGVLFFTAEQVIIR